MKRKYLLIILFLVLGILSYGIYYRCLRDTSFSEAAYWGTCSVCNCLYEIPSYQVSIIRQGGKSTCFICPKCQKNK